MTDDFYARLDEALARGLDANLRDVRDAMRRLGERAAASALGMRRLRRELLRAGLVRAPRRSSRRRRRGHPAIRRRRPR